MKSVGKGPILTKWIYTNPHARGIRKCMSCKNLYPYGVRRSRFFKGHIEVYINGIALIDLCSLCLGPPTVSPVGITVSLMEGQDRNVMYTVDFGNPLSVLRVARPGQLLFTNTSVRFTNTGVLINNVHRSDNGSYTATWENAVGDSMFTLDLVVTGEAFILFSQCT